jgi:hypothetical protein
MLEKDARAPNQNFIKIMYGVQEKMAVLWNFSAGEGCFKWIMFSKIYLVHIVFYLISPREF